MGDTGSDYGLSTVNFESINRNVTGWYRDDRGHLKNIQSWIYAQSKIRDLV